MCKYRRMSNQAKKLGQQVKDFRMDRQMTQPRAASFFGVSLATLCRIEAGKPVLDLTRAKVQKILAQQVQAVA